MAAPMTKEHVNKVAGHGSGKNNSDKVRKPVDLQYEDLVRGSADLSSRIKEAFGNDGLGLLTVSGVPGLKERRRALLPLARRFAILPDEVKARYEHKESFFSFGWSHGKEKLQGRPDLAKGSYYANPLYDAPPAKDEEERKRHVAFLHPNIWPKDDLPELESAFKSLGRLIVEVGLLICRQCDIYVHRECPSYPPRRLHDLIRDSVCCKARLLHYFPFNNSADGDQINNTAPADAPLGGGADFSNWCGWHNDHGSLTGLTPAMYLDEDGNEVADVDPEAGLYIMSPSGELVKASVREDQLAFQVGETAQIHSGGILQATPHAVKGSSVHGVSRETFAVFMEPSWDEPMSFPCERRPQDAQTQQAAKNLPRGVPPLASRWEVGMTFGQFTERTLNAYH